MPLVPWGQIVREYIAEDRCITQHTALWPDRRPFTVSADDVRRLFVPSLPKLTVDCTEFQQLITSAVDQCLSRSEMEGFVDHAARCSTCRSDYEMEAAVKTIVQSRLKMVKTPQALIESISREICQIDQNQGAAEKKQIRARILAFPIIKPMLALLLISSAVFSFVLSPFGLAPATLAGRDVLAYSVSNFHEVLAGLMQPQILSDSPARVREFLFGKASFPVHVPALDNCTLVGASASEYRGMKLAHVVYKHAGQMIYMFQAPYDRVKAGDGLALSDEAKQELARTASFSNVTPGGETVILWVLGNTLCAAVSRIDRNELSRCLASSEDASGKNLQ